MDIAEIINDETKRAQAFPVTAEKIFMGHAGVCALPAVARDAVIEFVQMGSTGNQERGKYIQYVDLAREEAAKLIGAKTNEIALIGPTSLGLNLVANGLDWQVGDEVVFYQDDYPANVYPWRKLEAQGVKLVEVQTEHTGYLTWEAIEASLTGKTKLVALASCSFLSGFRIDIEGIGQKLHERDILFCLDGIQTFGAAPVSMANVDFAAADSHKWMLGPVGAGVFYVNERNHDLLKPTVLGSWNVVSPDYVAQRDVETYYAGARRYESGTLNLPGIIGMHASMQLLNSIGLDNIYERLLHLRSYMLEKLRPLGWQLVLEEVDQGGAGDKAWSGIVTVQHNEVDMKKAFDTLLSNKIEASLRHNRAGEKLLRFSPHFYNTEAEIDQIADVLKGVA